MVLTCCLALLFLKAKERCHIFFLPNMLQEQLQAQNRHQKTEEVIGPSDGATIIV